MAKICPMRGSTVLYLDCLECEDKNECGKERSNMKKGTNIGQLRDNLEEYLNGLRICDDISRAVLHQSRGMPERRQARV